LIDFGSATCKNDCHNSYTASRFYRAPEIIIGCSWDDRIDVWAFGLVLAEVFLGVPLFYGRTSQEVLALQIVLFGSLPSHMLHEAKLAYKFIDFSTGLVYIVDPSRLESGVYNIQIHERDVFATMELEFGRKVAEVTRSMLVVDKSIRVSARVALDQFS
jgi:serine/threonine protein kinase